MKKYWLFFKKHAPLFFLVTIFSIAFANGLCRFYKKPPNRSLSTSKPKGIDYLMQNIEQIQNGESVYDLSQSYDEMVASKANYEKTEAQLRKEILGPAKQKDRKDFIHELKTIYAVGEHQDFFLRQIDYANIKLDLAIVGLGIIRVHQVLKGENAGVKAKDVNEFIQYIRDQVQSAVAAEDQNFKAIIFKGLESSGNGFQ